MRIKKDPSRISALFDCFVSLAQNLSCKLLKTRTTKLTPAASMNDPESFVNPVEVLLPYDFILRGMKNQLAWEIIIENINYRFVLEN